MVSIVPAQLFSLHSSRSLQPSIRRGDAADRQSAVRRGRELSGDKEKQMNVTKILGLAAIGACLVLAAPAERAQALSLINPGAAATVEDGSRLTTEVGWHHHHHHHHHWHHRH
jgi:hypothetical protein